MLRSLTTTVSCIALAFAVPYAAIAADSKVSAPAAAPAAQAKDAVSAKADINVEQQKQAQTAEKRKQITAEAMAAISETQKALKALDEGKKSDALAALERATGKLELILVRDPKLALAPTNVGAATIEVLADVDKVKELRKQAEALLDDGQVQAARHLLTGLASETVISVSNIPLATYPAAIKQAVKLVDEGKPDEAKKVLQTALNTLVITNTTIPLPVVATQEMLKEAEKLAEKADRKEDENKRLNDLLTQAHSNLEFAQALGYGTKDDFKNLYAQLDEIKDKTSGGKSGTGFFAKITSSLSSLVESSQPATGNPPATDKPADAKQPVTQPNSK
jgi:dGTP triphosphohydrolase